MAEDPPGKFGRHTECSDEDDPREVRNVYASQDLFGELALQTSATSGYKRVSHKSVNWTKKVLTEMGKKKKDVTKEGLTAYVLKNNKSG